MTPPIDIRSDDLRIVWDVLRRHLPADVRVWVFGSRASWMTKDSSDLDLAVEGDSEIGPGTLSALEAAFEDSDLAYAVDIVDLNRINERFRRIVQQQRVPLKLFDSDGVGSSRSEMEGGLYRPTFSSRWVRKPLYSMARWVNGLAFRNIEFSDTGKPVIKIAEIKGGISDQTKFTRQSFDDSVRVSSGDLLFSWSGQPETSINAFWWRGPEGWLNQHVFRVTPLDGIDTNFLYCLLRYLNPNFVAIARNKQTTGLGHVTKRDLERIEAGVPPFREQRAIAQVLGTLDDKIELNRRMNATLEAMARALFRSWFVDFDPVRAKMEGRDTGLPKEVADLFPDRLVESELGEIPDGWDVSQIGVEVDAVGGGTPSTKEPAYWNGGRHCWATPKDLSKLSTPALLGTDRKITDAGVRKISSGLLPRGTVLLSSRAPIGYLAITEVPTAVNQGFIAMICRKRLPALYVLSWCHENLEHIKDISGGSTFAEISKKTFRPLPVVVPSKWVLGVYDRASRSLHDRVVSNTRESVPLASLRDALLPRLVSGELRVNGLVPASGSVDTPAPLATRRA